MSTVLLKEYAQNALEVVVINEKFKDYKISVFNGSSMGENFLGEIFRAVVEGSKENGSKDSMSFIIKLSPMIKERRDLFMIPMCYQREIFTYNKLLPALDKFQDVLHQEDRFKYAKIYDVADEDYKELLILEDLCAVGFGLKGRFEPFDYDHLSLLIKNFARLHATSIVLKARNPEVFNEFIPQVSNKRDYCSNFQQYLDKVKTKILTIIPDKGDLDRVVEYFKIIDSEVEYILNTKTAAPYNVFCHGDCWTNNFLFKYKDGKVIDVIMIDWQLVRCASPVTDISIMIFLGTDKSMRTKHYDELLNLYYDTLTKNVAEMGIDISKYYPEEIYRDHIKKYMAIGFIIACIFLTVILGNIGEVPDLEDVVAEAKDDDFDYSVRFVERMQDIIKFCIQNNII